MNAVVDAVAQTGLHVALFGERGVGKSSLANIIQPLLEIMDEKADHIVVRVNVHQSDTFASAWAKAFEEVVIENEVPILGFTRKSETNRQSLKVAWGISDSPSIDEVRRVLAQLPGSVFVFDEFDRIPKKQVGQFADLIKSLSDAAIESTVILVGVSDTVDGLIKEHTSIPRALVQIHMPRMSVSELKEILLKASESLGMQFEEEASSRIARMSQGLPHYTHLVGQHAVREACQRRSFLITTSDVDKGFSIAVKQADHTIAETYGTATHSAHSTAIFGEVLLACAIAACNTPDYALGYFQAVDVSDPLSEILGRTVQIATFNSHLTEFCSDKRAKTLDRTGSPRQYRYRFRDPLLPPYIVIRGVSEKTIEADRVEMLLKKP